MPDVGRTRSCSLAVVAPAVLHVLLLLVIFHQFLGERFDAIGFGGSIRRRLPLGLLGFGPLFQVRPALFLHVDALDPKYPRESRVLTRATIPGPVGLRHLNG